MTLNQYQDRTWGRYPASPPYTGLSVELDGAWADIPSMALPLTQALYRFINPNPNNGDEIVID